MHRALIWSEQQIRLNGSSMSVAVVMTAPDAVSLSLPGNHMYLYPVHLDKGPRLPANPAIAMPTASTTNVMAVMRARSMRENRAFMT